MRVCPSCGAESPDDSRFCGRCGGRLDATPVVAEHRPVTALFCDLVGFTALCERADPEDVDRLLHEYYAAARGVIERFGGVVEKFVGDAVLGVFGVPTAHEDDAERAVRAGLSLVDEARGLSPVADACVQVRIGIDSGIAVARPSVDPASGEGLLIGDAVNTAARLQQSAAPMQVVVGEETQTLTAHAIEYDRGSARLLKGKRRMVPTWVARRPYASVGIDLRRSFSTPLVGREAELAILTGLFDGAAASSSPRFALLVGEAGQGKSRLVHELARSLDERPGLICAWRQGYCPAYAQRGAHHALAQIVRQHAGILESDDAEAAGLKLGSAACGGRHESWVCERLRPLVGLDAPRASQDESFAAWQQFLAALARPNPAVVVLEDLHWASEATLAFFGHLLREVAGVPLLVIGTARPELSDAQPAFVARFPSPAPSTARAVRLDIRSLSASETERLLDALAGEALTTDARSAAIRWCAGNPFHAEELVRWFKESGRRGDVEGGSGSAGSIPTRLKSLLASRLDALKPAHRALLVDAAVVGETFWPGALVEMGERRPAQVAEGLTELARRELVRRHHDTSVAGEDEFVFWHALTHDVAYGRLTRASRAKKHAAVARWIEAHGLHDAGLGWQLLAHHFAEALELSRAARDEALAGELLDPTLAALSQAGRRAIALDVVAAARSFERALALAPPSHPERPVLLLDWADAVMQEGRLDEAIPSLEQAAGKLSAMGRRGAAATAHIRCASAVYWRDATTAESLREAAVAELAGEEPCAELAAILEESAVQLSREYREAAAVAKADEAIALCARLGLPEPVRALAFRGTSVCALGDEGGLAGLRHARRLARRRGLGLDADIVTHLLADTLYPWRGPRVSLRVRREGLAQACRRGDKMARLWFEEGVIQDLLCCGRWPEALTACDRLEPGVTASESAYDVWELTTLRAHLLLRTGRVDEAAQLAEWSIAEARGNTGNLLTALAILAAARHSKGVDADAVSLLAELEDLSRDKRGAITMAVVLGMAVRVALDMGQHKLVERLLDGPCRERPLESYVQAGVSARSQEDAGRHAEAALGYLDVAERWRRFGAPEDEAFARLGHAHCAAMLGDEPGVRASEARARSIFRRLGAPFPPDSRRAVSSQGRAAARRG